MHQSTIKLIRVIALSALVIGALIMVWFIFFMPKPKLPSQIQFQPADIDAPNQNIARVDLSENPSKPLDASERRFKNQSPEKSPDANKISATTTDDDRIPDDSSSKLSEDERPNNQPDTSQNSVADEPQPDHAIDNTNADAENDADSDEDSDVVVQDERDHYLGPERWMAQIPEEEQRAVEEAFERPMPDLEAREMLNQQRYQSIVVATEVVDECFAALLLEQPSARGRLIISYEIEVIEGSGQFHLPEITTNLQLNDPTFEQCILGELEATIFDAPGSGTQWVEYPFFLDE